MEADSNSLGQIRDLLVGPQIQSIEDRLVELSERVDREIHGLHNQLNERSSSIEALLRQELQGLRGLVERNHAEHTTSSQSLAAETAELLTHLNQSSKSFEEQLGHQERELRQSIGQRIDAVEREMNSGRESLRYEVIELVERLQRDKADRSVLGRMFHEIAETIDGNSVSEDEPTHS